MNDVDHSQTTVDLARVPPPSLLFGLLSQRFTGRLEVDQLAPDPGARQIRFRGGMPTWTDWVQDGSRIGELAIAQGLASRAAIDVAVKAANGKRLGEQLVDSGVLTQDKVAALLRAQCMRRLLDLFALDRGEVRLVAETTAGDEALLPVNVLELVHRGVTARYDNTRVRRDLGAAWNGRFRATPSLARYVEQFKFRSEDGSVIGYLASGAAATVAELCEMPDATPARVAQLLGVLWHCQMIEGSSPENDRESFPEELASLEARIAAGDDPIAIIGVDNDADAATIDGAWLDLAARFDPRALAEEDEALRTRVTNVATTLRQVRDAARRRRLAIAEMTGLRLVADGKHPRGLALLEEAITLGASGPEIECAVVWARLHTQARGEAELQQADTVLARTIATTPDVATAYYYRGCVLAWLGKIGEATKALERARELDPRLVDAERQLRALQRGERPGAEPAKGKKKPEPPPVLGVRPTRASTNPLLSPGYKRLYWFSGVLLLLMILANIVLRLDADF